jgi:hypothetical protein
LGGVRVPLNLTGRGADGMTKTERVIVLLETLNEARDGDGSLGYSGEQKGATMNVHGSLWHSACREAKHDCLKPGKRCLSSYAELERALAAMRSERPSQFFHVTERYLRCSQIPKNIRTGTRVEQGKAVPVYERRLVTSWSPAVRLEKVRRGVEWLAGAMVRVELPAEYRDAMAKRAAA